MPNRLVLPVGSVRYSDGAKVGGKNASLGELISQLAASGVRVPGGFATTAQAFDQFLAHNKHAESIQAQLKAVNVEDVQALAKAGAEIRRKVEAGAVSPGMGKQNPGEKARASKSTAQTSIAGRSP